MMTLRLVILLGFLPSAGAWAESLGCAAPDDSVSRKELKGRLGVVAGTRVEIEAEIVSAEAAGHPDLVGSYFLKVLKVNGTTLKHAQAFRFSSHKNALPQLPNDFFKLYKLKTGKDVDELSAEEMERAEDGYVGRKWKLVAAEMVHPDAKRGRAPAAPSTLLLYRELKGAESGS